MKCPESLNQLQELERMLPLCKRELYEQAQARVTSGAANNMKEASRQLGEELNRDPENIRRAILREKASRGVTVSHLVHGSEYDEGPEEFDQDPQQEPAKPLPRGTLGTGETEWYTPIKYIDLARTVLGIIDLDPASSEIAQQSIQAKSFFTKDDNGLEQVWHGRVWLNPPYMQPDIALFVDKLVAEFQSGRVSEAILLTHNYTDTTWFHNAERACSVICFARGRIRFVDGNGNLASPTQGQAFFYFGKNPEKFRTMFAEVGFVR